MEMRIQQHSSSFSQFSGRTKESRILQGTLPFKIYSWCLSKTEISSVQFSRSVVSNSLRPHESQHARPPCPSPTPRVHPNPRPSSQWCHPATSSSVVPFSSCPQSLPTHQKSFWNKETGISKGGAVFSLWSFPVDGNHLLEYFLNCLEGYY